jgi:hypothetical protein
MTPYEKVLRAERLAGKPWDALDDIPLIRFETELDGFLAALSEQGRLTPEIQQAAARRRAEIQTRGRT